MKTYSAKNGEVDRQWWVIDLEDQTVGRAAAEIATLLRGKHKPQYTPHVDVGDVVVVITADKVVFSGNKPDQKIYYHHSGYPGGLKQETARELLERKPEEVIVNAVRGMLPKTKLGRQLIKKLKVFTGPEHKHQAQQPQTYDLGTRWNG